MPEMTLREAITRGLREALDADERAAVLGGNAQRLFGL